MSLQRVELEERQLALVEKRAKYFAKIPGLKKEIAGNPDAIVGICLSLEGYGMALTMPNINMAFDWIEGRAEPSALFYQALARHHGYRIRPKQRTADRAVAVLIEANGDETEVEFTVEDAIRAHRLDAWVEDWHDRLGPDGKPMRYTDSNKVIRVNDKFVVRVNGEAVTWQGDIRVALPDPLPDWVATKLAAGEVKIFTAWWDYRVDMMWKSAAKRAVKVASPDVLLGGAVEHEFVSPESFSPSPGWGSSAAGQGTVIDVEEVVEPEPAPAVESRVTTRDSRESRGTPDYDRVPDEVYDRSPEAQGSRPRRRPDDDPGRPF